MPHVGAMISVRGPNRIVAVRIEAKESITATPIGDKRRYRQSDLILYFNDRALERFLLCVGNRSSKIARGGLRGDGHRCNRQKKEYYGDNIKEMLCFGGMDGANRILDRATGVAPKQEVELGSSTEW